MATERICIRAHGFSLSVSSDCPETLSVVERYLLPWLPRTSGRPKATGLSISLTRNAAPGHFKVRLNDRVIAESEALPYLLNLIQQAADERMIATLDRRAAVHAGVVAYRGRAIILPGASGSGKSRLVQELLQRGAEYCSDEYAIFDRTGKVHPYPRALMIRNEGEVQHPFLASELRAEVRTEPIPAGLILFLKYETGAAGLTIDALDRSDALIRLLQNCPHILAENPAIVAPLQAAVAQASAWSGVRGDAEEAALAILRLAQT